MPPSIVEIRDLRSRDLEPALRDETAEWQRELDWDFSKSASLVRKLADRGTLSGAALLDGSEVAGYGYVGLENYKGLIAEVYVRPAWRKGWTSGNAEALLFRILLEALIGTSGARRVESQLMLVTSAAAQTLQSNCRVRLFERILMSLDSNSDLPPGRVPIVSQFRVEPWSDTSYEAAARLLVQSYDGQPDSRINDHYKTPEQASRFLRGVVEFPGSSTFCQSASNIAFDAVTGRAAGFLLSSFVASEVGHIAELCVTPKLKGAGLGYELLRQSAANLREAGAKRISLSVTAANEEALRLYRRCGFREMRRFYACVWQKN